MHSFRNSQPKQKTHKWSIFYQCCTGDCISTLVARTWVEKLGIGMAKMLGDRCWHLANWTFLTWEMVASGTLILIVRLLLLWRSNPTPGKKRPTASQRLQPYANLHQSKPHCMSWDWLPSLGCCCKSPVLSPKLADSNRNGWGETCELQELSWERTVSTSQQS